MSMHGSGSAPVMMREDQPRPEVPERTAVRLTAIPSELALASTQDVDALPRRQPQPRVLLIEDNPGDARLVGELLGEMDCCHTGFTHVERLSEGLAHLASAGADLVLLDLSLPDSTGLDTLLQVLHEAPDTPIVVLSGMRDETIALQAVRSGAQDYLSKTELTGRLLAHSLRYAMERARLEGQLRETLRREHEARMLAEGAVRSRDEILGIVAHDLRNPLGAINITLGLLLQGEIAPEQYPHHLRVMQRSATQLDRMIQDLLDVARIEGGTLRVEPRRFAPAALLRDAAEQFSGMAAEAELELVTECEPRLPDVLADPRRVMQVLSNLVANALRFTPRRGRITLRARVFGESVLYSVSDTGIGIAEEDLPHLFDWGWQARHARRDGTGRGLAICKGIVEAHHGRIWAASAVGEGTAFFFTVPLADAEIPADEPEVSGAAGIASGPAGNGSRALRILIVDDHPAIRHGLAVLLSRQQGMEVVGEAATGEEALDRTERLRPDVVLMDLAMPGMGGIEAARRITASMPAVRVLALTAESEEEALMPILRAGGSGFVRKTTAHQDLNAALATVARDEVFLYPSGNHLLLGEFMRTHGPERAALAGLNEQERQVLQLAAEGFTSTEIGKKLFLSPKTIDTYRSRLMRQLGLSHRSDLTRFALKAGLLKPE
ncbi:MAG TPA: response regulator [Longimicrobiaceae bacterium]